MNELTNTEAKKGWAHWGKANPFRSNRYSNKIFLSFPLLGTCIKVYRNQKKNTSNNDFIMFYFLLSYKIDKQGEVVAEPI